MQVLTAVHTVDSEPEEGGEPTASPEEKGEGGEGDEEDEGDEGEEGDGSEKEETDSDDDQPLVSSSSFSSSSSSSSSSPAPAAKKRKTLPIVKAARVDKANPPAETNGHTYVRRMDAVRMYARYRMVAYASSGRIIRGLV
jgi:hypothetical protein